MGDSLSLGDSRTLTGSEKKSFSSLMSRNCDNQEVKPYLSPQMKCFKGGYKGGSEREKSSFDVVVSKRICVASVSPD